MYRSNLSVKTLPLYHALYEINERADSMVSLEFKPIEARLDVSFHLYF